MWVTVGLFLLTMSTISNDAFHLFNGCPIRLRFLPSQMTLVRLRGSACNRDMIRMLKKNSVFCHK